MDQQCAINILGRAVTYAMTKGIFNDLQKQQLSEALNAFVNPEAIKLGDIAHQSEEAIFEGDERMDLSELNEQISLCN